MPAAARRVRPCRLGPSGRGDDRPRRLENRARRGLEFPGGPAVARRAVAQLGSALDWGSRGRRFKSCQPDRWPGAWMVPGLFGSAPRGRGCVRTPARPGTEQARRALHGGCAAARGCEVPVAGAHRFEGAGASRTRSSRFATGSTTGLPEATGVRQGRRLPETPRSRPESGRARPVDECPAQAPSKGWFAPAHRRHRVAAVGAQPSSRSGHRLVPWLQISGTGRDHSPLTGADDVAKLCSIRVVRRLAGPWTGR